MANGKILIKKNGCYLVTGDIPLIKEEIECDDKGFPSKINKIKDYPVKGDYALCRCGNSKNCPFCDGTHAKIEFDGTETASDKKYILQAQKIIGPNTTLTDANDLCFGAGFCHSKEGSVWQLSKSNDIEKSDIAIRQACNCPSGRLICWNKKTGEPIEPNYNPEISLLEEPHKDASGPIWAKGGIPLESEDGRKYETRNRVTLCRCGKSSNKPFCDGTHVSIGFRKD